MGRGGLGLRVGTAIDKSIATTAIAISRKLIAATAIAIFPKWLALSLPLLVNINSAIFPLFYRYFKMSIFDVKIDSSKIY